MRLIIKILFIFLCVFVLASNANAQIRVIDNKGTIQEIDASKWWQSGNNIYNKNSQNVIIGEPRTYVPSSRFTVNSTSTLPAFKLKYPFMGSLTDSILTWNSTDSIVRKIPINKLNSGDWHTLGNSGTNASLNFLGTIDNQDLVFKTNNTEKMRLTTSGNVGIGTNAPTAPLTFSGAEGRKIALWGGLNDNQYLGFGNAANQLVSQVDKVGSDFVWRAGTGASTSNTLMTLRGNGNLGIGNSAPTNILHISAATDPVRIEGLQAGTATNNIIVADATGVLKSIPNTTANNWSLTGNSSTSFATNFIGTIDNVPLQFKVYNTNSGRIGDRGNTALGWTALNPATTGSNNTAFGEGTLKVNTTGLWNAAVGSNALAGNTTGGSNVAFGVSAGITNTTGNNNTFLGPNADSTVSGLTNATAIGNKAKVGASNSMVLGGTGADAVNVGIGTTTPNNKLEIKQGTSGNSGLRLTSLTNATIPTLGSDKFLTVDVNGDVILRNVGENIVDFTSGDNNPNTAGTTFIPNDIQNRDVVYYSTGDNSSWKWTGTTYVAYTPTSTAWLQGGNSVTTQRNLGTVSNFNLPIITNNIPRMTVLTSATVQTTQIGVATSVPTFTAPANTGATIPTFGVDGTVNATNYTTPVQPVFSGAAFTWDMSKGSAAKWTMAAGANTLTVSNMKAGMYGSIVCTNSGTSTLTFSGGINKVINGGNGAPVLTPIANAVDILTYFYDGTTFWWTVGNNYN